MLRGNSIGVRERELEDDEGSESVSEKSEPERDLDVIPW